MGHEINSWRKVRDSATIYRGMGLEAIFLKAFTGTRLGDRTQDGSPIIFGDHLYHDIAWIHLLL
jgi:hypothetical protein